MATVLVPLAQGCEELRIQLVIATQALNLSAGVS